MNHGDEDYLSLAMPEKLLGEEESYGFTEELRKYDNAAAGTFVQLPEGVHIGGKDYSRWRLCLDGSNGYMDVANAYLYLKPGSKNLVVRISNRTVRNPLIGTAKDQKVLMKEYVPAEELYDELRDIFESEPESGADKTTVLDAAKIAPAQEDEGNPGVDAAASKASSPEVEKGPDRDIGPDMTDNVSDPEEDDEPYVDLNDQEPSFHEQPQPAAAKVLPAQDTFQCNRAPLCGYYDIQAEGAKARRYIEEMSPAEHKSGEMLDTEEFRDMLSGGMAHAMARRMAEAAEKAR